jgi:Uma2 family endonuclease
MMKDDFFIEEPRTIHTDYETERNKPLPNRLHGHIQGNIIFELRLNYRDQFNIESEVTLDTTPKSSTPDVCIFPKRIINTKDNRAKSSEMPLATIEIPSPSQSPEDLVAKAWEYYFPAGIKSAWIIIPALRAIRIILPDDQNIIFYTGEVHDPTNNIKITVDKIFEGVAW